jgi:hypothetical protein
MHFIVVKKLKDLDELDKSFDWTNNVIGVRVDTIKYIYKTIDRFKTIAVTINEESFSPAIDLKPFHDFMKLKKMRCMVLIANSATYTEDLKLVIKKIDPDEVVEL